jgi:tight adherence protein B
MAFIPAFELILAVAAAALCGALALPVALAQGLQLYHRMRLHTRVIGTKPDKGAVLAGLLRNGIAPLRPLAHLLLLVPWFQAKCKALVKVSSLQGHTATLTTICESLLAGFISVILVLFLVTRMFAVALCVALLTGILVFGKAQKFLNQWEERLVEQIPDALRSLGICFNSGYSLQQAFEQTALDTPDPLGSELKQACFDINAGRSIEEALSALEERTKASDLRFAIVALEIQHKTGGSLQDLLENATDAVLSAADLRRQLAVQTAQARLSAKVVTILPLILVAALSLSMEGYLQTFFSSPEGLTILLVALGLEILGVFIIRKILGVDVG